MNQTGTRFAYLHQKFLSRSDAKSKAGIFDGSKIPKVDEERKI